MPQHHLPYSIVMHSTTFTSHRDITASSFSRTINNEFTFLVGISFHDLSVLGCTMLCNCDGLHSLYKSHRLLSKKFIFRNNELTFWWLFLFTTSALECTMLCNCDGVHNLYKSQRLHSKFIFRNINNALTFWRVFLFAHLALFVMHRQMLFILPPSSFFRPYDYLQNGVL